MPHDNTTDLFADVTKEDAGTKLIHAYEFWANRRIIFNLVVGLAGIIPILMQLSSFYLEDIIGILIWALVANGLFSLGYVLESYVITRSKGSKDLERFREVLFWLGTGAYVLVTGMFAFLYPIIV